MADAIQSVADPGEEFASGVDSLRRKYLTDVDEHYMSVAGNVGGRGLNGQWTFAGVGYGFAVFYRFLYEEFVDSPQDDAERLMVWWTLLDRMNYPADGDSNVVSFVETLDEIIADWDTTAAMPDPTYDSFDSLYADFAKHMYFADSLLDYGSYYNSVGITERDTLGACTDTVTISDEIKNPTPDNGRPPVFAQHLGIDYLEVFFDVTCEDTIRLTFDGLQDPCEISEDVLPTWNVKWYLVEQGSYLPIAEDTMELTDQSGEASLTNVESGDVLVVATVRPETTHETPGCGKYTVEVFHVPD